MILNSIYHMNQGYECLSACLGNYIQNKYPRISNGEIIVAGNGLKVTYGNKILSTSMYQANTDFLNRYHISFDQGKLHSEEQAQNLIDSSVREGRELTVKVCAVFLDYNRVFKQSEHSSHCVNVVGLDHNKVYVCDSYVPTRIPTVFEGWINKDSLMEGWKGKNYEYIMLKGDYVLSEEQIISDTINSLINGIEEYLNVNKESAFSCGEEAIKSLIIDVENNVDSKQFKKFIIDLNYQIKIYGFLSLKLIVRDLIEKYKVKDEYVEQYNKVISSWNTCCNSLIKTGVSGKMSYFIATKKKILDTCDMERDLLERLVKELKENEFCT